ncbi:TPA: Ig-like domain-containing protein, partial [Vibrio parahaemolyticus]|nr:Ig-like domain-containing protein [Vibrio parahaemolyticus]HBB9976369.1 Ig-like domain-containing protein [Vibrio parahaemolyticus]HBC0012873.1 Ig-like domain-containing protein [Vibrio parahaemolyticus]
VTPKNGAVPIGLSQQMHADAVLENSAVVDVTTNEALTWSSSDPSIATIDSNGLVKGMATGTVTITAEGVNSDGSVVKDTATVTVTNAVVQALQVTPANETTSVGLTKAFTATAILSDKSTLDVTNDPAISWSSSDGSIASIITGQSSGNGVAKGKKPGMITVTAKGAAGGTTFEGSATLTVTDAVMTELRVTPTNEITPVGLTKAFTAIAVLSDSRTVDVTNDPAISWMSDNPSVATITSDQATGNGVATGESAGSVSITAEGSVNGATFSDTATLTVTDAIITALEVTPTTETVPVGLSQPFTAKAILSDGKTTIDVTDSPLISWTSSAPTTATINASGLATGVEVGAVTVKAAGVTPEGTELSDTATLEVTEAIITRLQVTPTTETTPKGLSKGFTATAILSDGKTTIDVTDDPSISWSSSDVNTATISSGLTSGNGEATGVKVGTVTITAQGTTPEGSPVEGSATLTVTDAIVTELQVTPPLETMPKGLTQAFTATALMSDGTNVPVTDNAVVSWSTSDSALATITTGQTSGNGIATGEDVGTVTVTATGTVGTETFEGSAQLTVTDAIAQSLAVTPAGVSIAKGLTQRYTATLTLSDGSTEDVTDETATSWTSGAAATIDASGLAKGESVGEAQITASGTYDGVSLNDTQTLTVTAAEVIRLEVTPEMAEIAKGRTLQFTAKAIFTDTSTQDVTAYADTSWVSSTNAASLSGATAGLANGDNVGDTIVTATYSGFSDTADLTVTAAALESIEVSPNPIEVGVGETGMLTATGYYSDGTTPDITSLVDWTGQDTAIATVESGTVTGVSEGSTSTIAALDDGYGTTISSEATTLNVILAPIVIPICGGAIDDTDPTNATGNCLKVATDNDGNWFSSTPSIAVMNALGYSEDPTSTNSGDTYASTYTESGSYGPTDGEFATFTQQGINSEGEAVVEPGDGDDANAGVDGQFDRWCQKLSELEFGGKTTWRRPTKLELNDFLQKYKDEGAEDGLWSARGWPTAGFYMSSTVSGTNYSYISLRAGTTYGLSAIFAGYAPCVSNP